MIKKMTQCYNLRKSRYRTQVSTQTQDEGFTGDKEDGTVKDSVGRESKGREVEEERERNQKRCIYFLWGL